MKKLLIIYNIVFLIAGNILLATNHYSHNHSHVHDTYTNECEECIIIENSTNYFTDFDEEKFLKNKTFQFVLEYFSAIDLSSAKIYLSRAPPLS